jgi:hypothetical protein
LYKYGIISPFLLGIELFILAQLDGEKTCGRIDFKDSLSIELGPRLRFLIELDRQAL